VVRGRCSLSASLPRGSNLRFAQGRPKSYGLSATADVFPSPRTRRGWVEPSAIAVPPKRPGQSRPPLPSSSWRRSSEVSNQRSTRCCRPSPRLIFAPAALASGWSSSSLATSACAVAAVPKAFEPGVWNRPKPVPVALRSSASPLPGAWCGDALRALLKSLHGRIAHAASSFTRGTPDMRCTFVFRLSSGGGRSRFRLHPLLFRCHPRDALRTSTLAWEECASGKKFSQEETKPVL